MDKTRITKANKQHARRSAGAGEIKEINMDRDTIIDGLRMTMDLCVFDPSTGEEIEPHLLNDISRATYDACKGALEILKRLDTDSDTISRQAAIEALYHVDEYNGRSVEAIRKLPPAQPEPLTDKEQRIFLEAMERERKVCKEVDDQYVHEPYEVLLTKVCDEIKRKVKKVLWT